MNKLKIPNLLENTTLNNIKKWIYIVQKLYANVRDYKENDI